MYWVFFVSKVPNQQNKQLALNMVAIVVGMLGLAYASVPLYNLFCRVTGYGGTTQQADVYPETISDRVVTVRFNADVNRDLGWEFKPEQSQIQVRIGEPVLVYYYAKNLADSPTIGTSVYNVTPPKAGSYFNKVECFCFEEQKLAVGEKIRLPVSFFIDPDMLENKNLDDVSTITLSYTFFEVKR